MKKKVLYAAMSLALIAVPSLSGCSSNVMEVSSEEISIHVKTVTVYEGYLNQGPIFTGTVQAKEEVSLAPKVSGRIASIPVEVGMNVRKGDLLLTLEDEDLKNQTLQSEAAVEAAKSGIEAAKSSYELAVISAENGVHQAAATVSQLENSLEELEAAEKKAEKGLEDAQANFNRTKELFTAGAVSKSQLEQAETSLVSAEAGLKSVEANIKTTEDKLAAARMALENAETQLQLAKQNPQISVSEEQLKQAQAAAEISSNSLGEAMVQAPISGAVVAINGDEGELVSPQNPVMVVADLGEVRILVYVPAKDINQIEVGDAVQVKTIAADFVSMATVKSISPRNEQGKGYPVEIIVPNPEQKLKPGMVSEVMFLGDGQQKGMIIPASALVEKDGQAFVYKDENGQAKLTEVEVKEATASQVLITKGVSAGDKIITTKVEVLENGLNIVED